MCDQYEQRYMLDTNALLTNPDIIFDMENVVVPIAVIKELDSMKGDVGERGYKARAAIRSLRDAEHVVKMMHNVDYRYSTDEQIINLALQQHCILVTGDYAMQLQAEARGLVVIEAPSVQEEEEYSGWLQVQLNNEELADFYQAPNENVFGLFTGEYLIIADESKEPVDAYRWNGVTHEQVAKKVFQSAALGKLVPKDFYQMCAMDSIVRNSMTMIKGKAGSGKSLVALSYAMQMLEKGKYDKLICFVNPVATRKAARLGFYPGNRNEKLLDSSVGAMLSAKLGNKFQVEEMIRNEQLVLLPFSDIRGFDTTGMNAICYIMEAQNLNKDLMKLAIQRCGDDTKLIIDGDYHQQVDDEDYEGSRNGMRRVSEVFRGEPYYGEVELPVIYRSRMAARAESL